MGQNKFEYTKRKGENNQFQTPEIRHKKKKKAPSSLEWNTKAKLLRGGRKGRLSRICVFHSRRNQTKQIIVPKTKAKILETKPKIFTKLVTKHITLYVSQLKVCDMETGKLTKLIFYRQTKDCSEVMNKPIAVVIVKVIL